MRIVYGIGPGFRQTAPRRDKVITVGVFDGVHRGHQYILGRVVAEARARGLKSAVVTFSLHPSHLVRRHEKTPHLMSLRHKLHYLAEAGIDICYVLDFNRSLAAMPPEDFVAKILIGRMGMASLYVGEDFVFGRGGRGSVDDLRRFCRRMDFSLHVIKPHRISGGVVSSTVIRSQIRRGDLVAAQKFLGRPVALLGRVIKGDGRGRLLGFPTANILAEHEVLVPDGIYAAWALCGGRAYAAAVYLGTRPTFYAGDKRHIEVFLIGARRNVYGKMMEVRFARRVRPDRRFPDAGRLISQIKKDIQQVRGILSSSSKPRMFASF
ncbi:riboflavin biosynthesis protein RibF [Candidatus Velamenicoccus archaeovorus]|uniref:Riboflavin biosynthesis protein n=1 Tax=Velamenicoccus archaeovorus TaxID=1930593 RepID=A0A410P517_VELA1|nr:riboflavin biosynthesis protein RibF [Candidatus Velamenicoccus archaeovorus]QAT17279.1 riboflavin biosynthesis protein RibF [Candidatus Velamenicoccus archaeovorus]